MPRKTKAQKAAEIAATIGEPGPASRPWWKRERVPAQTSLVKPLVRGPIRKLMAGAIALALTASIMSASPASANEGCDMKNGPDNVTLGALLYVREVFDDAVEKYKEYKTTNSAGAIQHIERDNDYLCWIPKEQQFTLQYLTDTLLIWTIDILQS